MSFKPARYLNRAIVAKAQELDMSKSGVRHRGITEITNGLPVLLANGKNGRRRQFQGRLRGSSLDWSPLVPVTARAENQLGSNGWPPSWITSLPEEGEGFPAELTSIDFDSSTTATAKPSMRPYGWAAAFDAAHA